MYAIRSYYEAGCEQNRAHLRAVAELHDRGDQADDQRRGRLLLTALGKIEAARSSSQSARLQQVLLPHSGTVLLFSQAW